MKDILADIYNKVLNFFQQEKDGNSKEIASNRLKLVLMQDRTNLDAGILEKMRVELVDVISRYVEIDQEEFAVNLAGEGDSVALMLNIPVLRAKTTEEIEEAEAARKQSAEEAETVDEEASDEDNGEETQEQEKTSEDDVEDAETEGNESDVEDETASEDVATQDMVEDDKKKK